MLSLKLAGDHVEQTVCRGNVQINVVDVVKQTMHSLQQDKYVQYIYSSLINCFIAIYCSNSGQTTHAVMKRVQVGVLVDAFAIFLDASSPIFAQWWETQYKVRFAGVRKWNSSSDLVPCARKTHIQ